MSERDETRNEIGTAIRIHDNAIASIAAIAAMDVEGVKGIEKGLKAGFLAIISGGRVGPMDGEDVGEPSLSSLSPQHRRWP